MGWQMKVAVIGAGSWGTALAKLAAEAGHEVMVWAYEPDVAAEICQEHRNTMYLPGVDLPRLYATHDLAEAVHQRDLLVSVMPSHVVREVWRAGARYVTGDPICLSATKGIETGTLASMSEILRDVLPERLLGRIAVLSGPSFAVEVARRQPTAVVAAAESVEVARQVQRVLGTDAFRIYTSTDVCGVELGGAAKNVIAIAVGMSDGMGFGANARAALITRGLAEVTRLAVARGANPMTLAGLSGIGDLVLTCTGDLSRNRQVGVRLGRGESLESIQSGRASVAEGISNAQSCADLAKRLAVEMPVTEMVHAVLYEGLTPREGAVQLMRRAQKDELAGMPERAGMGHREPGDPIERGRR